ncbi:hypothetical protein LshimejAT787_0803020 [Lyophyllum shimeji]|uniref:Uncharacterized protein n=1 Tax=Lyophyllum shimeji TaxID=47721 RepID=A0A9P3PRJ8_LYOSH|nr:hypothetical protein LshimejAT787_0803020 [Lyophyllum shimeji]
MCSSLSSKLITEEDRDVEEQFHADETAPQCRLSLVCDVIDLVGWIAGVLGHGGVCARVLWVSDSEKAVDNHGAERGTKSR